MLVEEVTPLPVAQRRDPLRRPDDVGEEDRGEGPVEVDGAPRAGQELLDLTEHHVGVAGVEEVGVARDLDQPAAGDVRGEVAAVVDAYEPVARPVDHEGGRLDGRKRGAHVEAVDGSPGGRRDARAHGRPQEADQRFLEVRRGRGREELQPASAAAPLVEGGAQPLVEQSLRDTGRVVGRPAETGEGVDEDERRGALRAGGGGEHRHDGAGVAADQRRVRGADVVEHGEEVVSELLDHDGARVDGVGEAGAPLVEEDQPAEGGEALEEAAGRGDTPYLLDVAEPCGDEDNIDGPVAEHLVGDVVVSESGVEGLWHQSCASPQNP